MEAITTAAQLLRLGESNIIIAGGTESMSRIPLLYGDEATALFLRLGRAKNIRQRLAALVRFRPRHFRPVLGVKLGLTDPVSGLMMGETAEVLAKEFGITRQEQDALALESHRRAVAAQKQGALAEELVPYEGLAQDVGPRPDQSLDALARLKPFFQEDGSVTVGNSCQVTDGAAAVVLTTGERCRTEGRTPLGYLRAYAYAGCDPRRMGLGPVHATHRLLQQTGLRLADFDLVELNEAFAAQVLACERAFASDLFARDQLSRGSAIGELDRNRLNVNGGAIALGHPVGATGTRLVVTLLAELRRRGLQRGLATLCVGGGQGAALLVERG
jgi:acetyl-CoA C-acetyltransferase/acetyl-CoA acyltransferase